MNQKSVIPRKDFNELIYDIYGSTKDKSLWPCVVSLIDNFTKSDCSAILCTRRVNNKILGHNITTAGFEGSFHRYQDCLMEKDNVTPLVRNINPGVIASSVEFFGTSGVKNSTVYNDFYVDCGFLHFMGVNLLVSEDLWITLASFRGPRSNPHGDVDRDFFQVIAPHVLQSLQIGDMINRYKMESDSAFEVMDGLSHAIALLDSRCRILKMNDRAHSLLENGIFKINQDREIDLNSFGRFDVVDVSKFERPTRFSDKNHNYRIFVMDFDKFTGSTFFYSNNDYRKILIALDVGEHLSASIRSLQTRFCLTPAETRTCEVAVRCSSSYAMAKELNLSRETIRTHMKHIFLKMGVSSHVELLQNIAWSALLGH